MERKVFEMRFCSGIRRYATVLCGVQENALKTEVQLQNVAWR